MSEIILAATTDAAASSSITVRDGDPNSGTHHVTAPGIAGVEVATVQKENNDGSYSDYYVDGTIQQITATNTGVLITGPGAYRVNKGATAAAVGVEVSTNGSP